MTEPSNGDRADIIERNRKFYREIVEDDGGESEQMTMLRELIEECERLQEAKRRALAIADERAKEAAETRQPR